MSRVSGAAYTEAVANIEDNTVQLSAKLPSFQLNC